MTKVNLLDFDHADMKGFFASMGEKAFRATQVFQWIHQKSVIDYDDMLNLSKSFRERLKAETEIKLPKIALEKVSTDGTRKWLFELADGNRIETVFIPENDRGTLCISSEVGCALNCQFCSTGKQGFNRDLTVAEIIGQLWMAVNQLATTPDIEQRTVTNIVMMGMGEPLMNFDNVVKAMNIMLDDLAYGLSKYRVTLSTAGVVPQMKKLRAVTPAALAVSLHAPNNALRDEIVPINRKYPLEELIEVCKNYYADEPRRSIMFEYVMLDEVNDTLLHAKQLIALLRDVRCKINLIPFNNFSGTVYRCSKSEAIIAFKETLQKAGYVTTVRKTRGDDMDGACGQLVGTVKPKIPAYLARKKTIPIDIVKE